MKFILGYPIEDVPNGELKQYQTINEASFETEEWCIVDADSLEEAIDKYEDTFLKWKKNN